MPSSSKALEESISQQLDDYISDFNKGDFDKAATNYLEPAVTLSASSVSILSNRQDLADMLSSAVTRLRKDGFDHSEYVGPKKIIILDDKGLALASCATKRLRKDGTSCEEFTATYTLRRTDESGWLIAAIHSHPIDSQLK
ncbi:hypothetical protein P152DRAFT_449564 [Eremomyces bilateralis CBS 781.70]|uniref:DUF6841 domain-containing protein n=1 Tax=Eremomyces bilateralis CBS 781.70 TaxID=1392243 RepID=A0A6G1G2F8_9PEZI|nr:uncharacterized protein P152DRAFT_449564 [Eremomyces bilateralis CBS 781.70]KAF1812297.1 hypothetical protein P152DRAFT_449564 [Eremomyces bilateralis CBS 781.70]